MFQEERLLLRMVASVAGMLIGSVLAMTLFELSPSVKVLLLGVALIGHMSVLLLLAFFYDQRRIAAQKRKARRFKRYPQT